MERRMPAADRLLTGAAALYVIAYVCHFADHIAIGLSKTPLVVIVAGTIAGLTDVAIVGLARRGHPYAPYLGVAIGASSAVGYAAVHLPFDWGPFSQPFAAGTTAWSWASVAFAITSGLILAVAGMYALHARALTHVGGGVREERV